MLEELGIGRPSTYAPIISKIQQRGYVVKNDNKSLAPTPLGKTVNEQLVNHFGDVVDFNFTADMESKLDDIAENEMNGKKLSETFIIHLSLV